ncbi:LOW QUALITY PROTEIN: transcription factor CP2-like protein 1 [Bos taurus]|uniref:LOW QUALITY PROTEIN: transcription factor CP2-like protein 1 n=1 Tax=Bos taurus TaxID=9913 RepID=UPI0028CB1CAE|nr:LOW QUALITY PROTEIN: transcription factor CP2-like protein 1 [Bos taurus]
MRGGKWGLGQEPRKRWSCQCPARFAVLCARPPPPPPSPPLAGPSRAPGGPSAQSSPPNFDLGGRLVPPPSLRRSPAPLCKSGSKLLAAAVARRASWAELWGARQDGEELGGWMAQGVQPNPVLSSLRHSWSCSLSKMLFWHNQLEHLWPSPRELYRGPPSSLLRPWLLQGYLLQQTVGSLEGESGRKSQSLLEEGVDRAEASRAFLFQEELANIPRAEQPCPVFQYVLCAATSLAQVNQGALDLGMERGERGASQSYEVQMLCNPRLVDATQEPRLLKSVVRVVFHDRRLQYTEQQQLDGWRWSWPGDRILDITLLPACQSVPADIPLSVGVLEPQVLPSQLNTVEFYWDPTKRTSLFLHVHCISTKFTRKKAGEKSVPFCLQIDTFKPSDKELPLEHLHSAGCLLKVFKPKGADRKLKTDREKIEKQPVHERNKYQTACESTIFMECSPWPELVSGAHLPLSPFALTSPHSCKLLSPERLCSSPSFTLDTLGGSLALVSLPPTPNSSKAFSAVPSFSIIGWPCPLVDRCGMATDRKMVAGLNPGASVLETQQWLHRHWFSSYWRLLASFTGTDLLKLTPQDLIQICGAADGIRLFNTLRARPIRHQLTLYVAQETCRQDDEVPKNPDSGEVLGS